VSTDQISSQGNVGVLAKSFDLGTITRCVSAGTWAFRFEVYKVLKCELLGAPEGKSMRFFFLFRDGSPPPQPSAGHASSDAAQAVAEWASV